MSTQIKQKTVLRTTEEMRIISDISGYKGKYNLITFLATTDFRFKVKGNSFKNDTWDLDFIEKNLMYPNKCVDLMHMKGDTLQGYIVAFENRVTNSYKRKQRVAENEVALHYILVTMLIPTNTQLEHYVNTVYGEYKTIGASITAGHMIDPVTKKPVSEKMGINTVTVCHTPCNEEAFSILGDIDNCFQMNMYPDRQNQLFKDYSYNHLRGPLKGGIPPEVYKYALEQYKDVSGFKPCNVRNNVLRDFTPVTKDTTVKKRVVKQSAYNLFSKAQWASVQQQVIAGTLGGNYKDREKYKFFITSKVIAERWAALSQAEKDKYKPVS